MTVCYSIRDWDANFEVSQSRNVKGPHAWVAIPTKHDGKGFRRIMARDDGPVVYGAWILIVQIAAKCPKRGVLADSDGPITPADMAIKTGCPESIFSTSLNVLCSKEIGWMQTREVVADYEQSSSALPLQDKTNKTNQPTNQTDTERASERVAFCDSWPEVMSRLSSLGIVNSRQAVAEARDACNCTPDWAMKLIDYAQAHGKEPGAIVWRFKRAVPSLPLEQGWPQSGDDSPAVLERVAKASERKRLEDADSRATAMIKAGRRDKKPDQEIAAELTAAGLDWPK